MRHEGEVVARAVEKRVIVVFIVGNTYVGIERGVILLGGPNDLFNLGWPVTSGAKCLEFDNKAVKQTTILIDGQTDIGLTCLVRPC